MFVSNQIFCRLWNPRTLREICTFAINSKQLKMIKDWLQTPALNRKCPNSAVSIGRRSVRTFELRFLFVCQPPVHFSCKISYSFPGSWAAPISRAVSCSARTVGILEVVGDATSVPRMLQLPSCSPHSQNMQLPRSFAQASWEVGDVIGRQAVSQL